MASNDEQLLDKVQYRFQGPGSWRVRRFELTEEIDAPYDCSVDLVSEDDQGDPAKLFGACCTLEIARGSLKRRLNGVVLSVVHQGTMAGHVGARIKMGPALQLASYGESTRIFKTGMTAPKIIESVLDDPARRYHRKCNSQLTEQAVPREVCVQYRETNLQFVRRLMQEEGISFYFDQSGEDEVLVLVDSNDSFPDCKTLDGKPVPIAAFGAVAGHLETLASFESVMELGPTKVSVLQQDWTRPATPFTAMSQAKGDPPAWEVYEPGERPVPLSGYDSGKENYTREHLKDAAQLRLEGLQARLALRRGSSNVTGLTAGMNFEVRGHPTGSENQKYLVLSAQHIGVSEEDAVSGEPGVLTEREGYRNWITCIPTSIPYRPASVRRPVVQGIVAATVVGPDSEEVEPDVHGRVMVLFHWDRERRSSAESPCWVRVAQSWAGRGFGTLFIPRIGMEVAVQFVEGNPDWPIIVGCLYNGDNPPPYMLPKQKTKSGIRTRSSRGGGGANELRFEDKKTEEEIYLHAQKDLNEVVEHDRDAKIHHDDHTAVDKMQTLTVGKDREKTVEGNETIEVKLERKTTVTKKVTETFQDEHERSVKGPQKFTLEKDKIEHIKAGYELTTDKKFNLTQGGTSLTFADSKVSLDAAGAIHVKRGPAEVSIDDSGKVVVSTPQGISLQCGSNKLELLPSGIEINGMKIACTAGPATLELGPAGAKMSGPMTTVEGTATCSVKGLMVNVNS